MSKIGHSSKEFQQLTENDFIIRKDFIAQTDTTFWRIQKQKKYVSQNIKTIKTGAIPSHTIHCMLKMWSGTSMTWATEY
jgi:hypothetical protein